VGVGEDFEYRTSPDTFLAVQCRACKLVYLDPRPAVAELDRIYPDDYHAFAFTPDRFGFVYKVRRKLEARRLLSLCRGLPPDALITDVGCGDGFHLELLREFGPPGWRLEGIDLDERAAKGAAERSLTIHIGDVRTLDLPSESVDLALMIHTIEHVEDPGGILRAVQRLLKPGGRLLVLTDNTDSLDFRLFRNRHWGGYHFPRHWNLFNADNLGRLARASGLEVDTITTAVSPVNWLYSVRNTVDDLGAPRRLVDWLGLESTVPLAAFTAFDTVHKLAGRGALLRAVLRRPA
jgi:SAM-dependent methyltransferase